MRRTAGPIGLVCVAGLAVAAGWVQTRRAIVRPALPTYATVDLKTLANDMYESRCPEYDGKRVALTGFVSNSWSGSHPYALYYSFGSDHPREQKRAVTVVPASGDRMPSNRDEVVVLGVLHVRSDGPDGTHSFTLAADRSIDAADGLPIAPGYGLLGLLPYLAFPLVGVVAVRQWWHLHRLRHRRPGCCVACGYDLRASPGRCPECGR